MASTTTSPTRPGTETKVARSIYEAVAPQRRGRLIYYRRERPRLAAVEVWTQGDNIALDVIGGGGSVELTGTFGGLPGFDGRYESNFLQFVWSSDPRFENRGIMTLDLGARFWLNYFRMVGGISGVDEMVVRISDGTRDSNGSLKWREMHRQNGGTVESEFEKLRASALSHQPDIHQPSGPRRRVQHRRPHPRGAAIRGGLPL